MANARLEFPKYFPPGCPPNDSSNEELEVYRYCINSDIVLADDFISYYQSNPNKYKNVIIAYGLSVLLNREECEKGLKLPGIKKKFKGFSKGATYKDKGMIKRTPTNSIKSHCTWWIYESAQPENYFVIQSSET